MTSPELLTPTVVDTKRYISFSEKGIKYTADNPSRKMACEYHNLDKSDYFLNQPCVDYAIYLDKEIVLYLIELKGSDIEQAYHQVVETAKKLLQDTDLNKGQICGRIVLRKVRKPALSSNKLKSLKIECNRLKLQTEHKAPQMTETI